MNSLLKTLFAAALLAAQPVFAGEITPVELQPMKHRKAQLTVIAPDGTTRTYTPAQLEQFPTYQLTTATPWRDEPAVFEGVLLADVLSANGLSGTAAIQVTAENDYSTSITQSLIEEVEILVATRVEGKPHTRRARGPIQFVIDAEAFAGSDQTSESNFVWMAARIEPEG